MICNLCIHSSLLALPLLCTLANWMPKVCGVDTLVRNPHPVTVPVGHRSWSFAWYFRGFSVDGPRGNKGWNLYSVNKLHWDSILCLHFCPSYTAVSNPRDRENLCLVYGQLWILGFIFDSPFPHWKSIVQPPILVLYLRDKHRFLPPLCSSERIQDPRCNLKPRKLETLISDNWVVRISHNVSVLQGWSSWCANTERRSSTRETPREGMPLPLPPPLLLLKMHKQVPFLFSTLCFSLKADLLGFEFAAGESYVLWVWMDL